MQSGLYTSGYTVMTTVITVDHAARSYNMTVWTSRGGGLPLRLDSSSVAHATDDTHLTSLDNQLNDWGTPSLKAYLTRSQHRRLISS